MLKTLKEEYQERKGAEKARELQEARELLESTVLVVEKLNTSTLSRIVDAMNGVEQALGPFLGKLKSLQVGLDAAEQELTNLINGAGGNDPRKTSAMLGKAMMFYQGVSEFLRDDLQFILKLPAMGRMSKFPDQPVGSQFTNVFRKALAVSKGGGFIRKLFANTNIPYVNNDQLAQELTTLSFQELEGLNKVGKMPVVLPQAQVDAAAQAATGAAPAPAAPKTQIAGTPPVPTGGPDLRNVMDKLGGPRALINFLQKNQLDNADTSTVMKALDAVLKAGQQAPAQE